MRPSFRAAVIAVLAFVITMSASAQRAVVRPLSATDVSDIATLLKLEDTRQFDVAALTRLVASAHPEVKRRAITSVGRIADVQGWPLLTTLHRETDPELLATVAFATGQLKDPGAVGWLGQVLNDPKTPPTAAKEAAQALGKLRTPDARTALAAYLATAPATTATAPVVGEALLAIGRFPVKDGVKDGVKDDLSPILRWTSARDVEVRWRAAWALFRPRDPSAVPALLTTSVDASPDVRFWSVRGLAPALVDQSGLRRDETSARLRQAVNDPRSSRTTTICRSRR